MRSFPATREAKGLRTYYVRGGALGAAAALRRLFFLFGAALGVSSGADVSACETELGEKYNLAVSQSSSIFPGGRLLTLAPRPVQVQQ